MGKLHPRVVHNKLAKDIETHVRLFFKMNTFVADQSQRTSLDLDQSAFRRFETATVSLFSQLRRINVVSAAINVRQIY